MTQPVNCEMGVILQRRLCSEQVSFVHRACSHDDNTEHHPGHMSKQEHEYCSSCNEKEKIQIPSNLVPTSKVMCAAVRQQKIMWSIFDSILIRMLLGNIW